MATRGPRGEVEEAISGGVELQAMEGLHRAASLAGQHVVPLEDLVKDEPSNKPPKPIPRKRPGAVIEFAVPAIVLGIPLQGLPRRTT
jgi:hypothetical protein